MSAGLASGGAVGVQDGEQLSLFDAAGADLDPDRGSAISELAGVSMAEANEMFDAVQIWADGSSGIKDVERGLSDDPKMAEAASKIHDFQDKMPAYEGNIVRVIGVPQGTKYRKGGKIYSDGSTTSWTVPSNVEAAKTFVREGDQIVVLHVKTTKGIDTRGISNLTGLDQEIMCKGGYDGSLKIDKVVTKDEYRPGSPVKEKVRHVYLSE